MRSFFVIAALVMVFFSSCNRGNIYTHEEEINGYIWTYRDSLSYEFEIKDTAQLYSMQLNVLHDNDLPYENLYVKIRSVYPDKLVKNDVLSLEFADESGTWMGEKEGEKYLAPIALQPIAKFSQTGLYKMVFYQNSRRDSVPGIHSLELSVDKQNN